MLGELAALGTAAFFGVSSTLTTLAGRRVGAGTVNRSRLLVATLLALLLHRASRGAFLPVGHSSNAWLWLGTSGVIGLALGDAMLFQGYVLIGPQLSMLILALAPVFAALLSTVFLDESLSLLTWSGIGVTILGVGFVVSEPGRRAFSSAERAYGAGLLFALGGALGQALGLVTAKAGLAEGVAAQSANLMRILAAAVAIWIWAALTGRLARTYRAFESDSRAGALTVLAAVAGPLLGVWLSLVALEHTSVGVASTLMSLTPILLLPVARVLFHEPVTWRAVLGTVIALSGAALLFR
jgi:drug/metabolite transporter (DMT)-like permease